MSEAVLLDVGCGAKVRPGHVGIDRKHGGEAFPLALNDGTPVANESADRIVASHVLEHFSHTMTANVLADWTRALKPGGWLKVAVPNFEWIAREYLGSREENAEPLPLLSYLFGAHSDENDAHCTAFDRGSLAQFLEAAGLVDVQEWESDVPDCSSLPVSLNLMARKPEREAGPFDWLIARAYNRYSQYGEDGAFEAIFEKISTTNRWCIECGAGDGIRYSNTRKLIEEGWSAVLIEKDRAVHAELAKNIQALGLVQRYAFNENYWHFVREAADQQQVWVVQCEAQASGAYSLDAILATCGCPNEPDLMVIDVDGPDYYLWNGLLHYQPRVVLCEYDPFQPPEFIPPPEGPGQAGSQAIRSVAYSKHMRQVAQIGVNLLFVRAPLMQQLADRPIPSQTKHPIGERVAAVMSVPRLLWADNMTCAVKALVPLGVTFDQFGGVFWEQTLTQAIERYLDERAYVLTIDYDTLFNRDDVLELYRLMEEHPDLDALVPMEMQQGGARLLFTLTDRAGNPRQTISHAEMQQDLVPIRTGHFGLTMLRTESLKRLPKPWFLHRPDPQGGWGDERVDSDVAFWVGAEQAGLKVCLAPRVIIGHLTRVALWPGQSLAAHYQPMDDYQAKGKPPEAWRCYVEDLAVRGGGVA
mgnify:CR=1 FL=1